MNGRLPSVGRVVLWGCVAALVGACGPDRGAPGGGPSGGGGGGGGGDGDGDGPAGDDAQGPPGDEAPGGDPGGGRGDPAGGEGEAEGEGEAGGEGEGEAGDGGAPGDEGEGEGDPEGGDPGVPSAFQPAAPPLLSSVVIQDDDEGGRLRVHCPDGEAGTSAADAIDHGRQGLGFPTAGTYDAWCVLPGGSRLTGRFTVVHEALDDSLEAIGLGAARMRAALAEVVAADGAADAAMVAALADLEGAAADLALGPTGTVLRPFPGGWPNVAGRFPAGEGDGALPGLLADLEAALSEAAGQFSSLDAVPALAALDATNDRLSAVADRVRAGLKASPQALMANLPAIERILQDALPAALHAPAATISAALRRDLEAAGVDAPARNFGLVGLAVGMVGVGGFRGWVIENIYGPFIDELDTMINTLIIADIIADHFVVGNAPSIFMVQASASVSFACPGYPTHIFGDGFDPDPANTSFLVIGPALTAAAEAIFDAFPDDGDSLYDTWEAVDNAVKAINDALDASFMGVETALRDGFLAEWDLFIGPFPISHEGRLPQPIVIFPIGYFGGLGQPYELSLMPHCG